MTLPTVPGAIEPVHAADFRSIASLTTPLADPVAGSVMEGMAGTLVADPVGMPLPPGPAHGFPPGFGDMPHVAQEVRGSASLLTASHLVGPPSGVALLAVNLDRIVTVTSREPRQPVLALRRHGALYLGGPMGPLSFDRPASLLLVHLPALAAGSPGLHRVEADGALWSIACDLAAACAEAAGRDRTAPLVAAVRGRLSDLLAGQGPGSAAAATACLQPYKVKQIRAHVEAHMAEPFRLDRLAEIACLSRYHFCRSFKMATGMTPLEFVTEMRVERCRQLILCGDDGLAEIAVACGFASQSHMTTTMRRLQGVTPGRLRQMHGRAATPCAA
ncbi:MAG: hypothetical protein RLY86_2930 [Pseudomonadota bacterium]|jgi:AraC-like DNA-binding protein